MNIIIKILINILPLVIYNMFSKKNNKKDINIQNLDIPKLFWVLLGVSLIIFSIGISGALIHYGSAKIQFLSKNTSIHDNEKELNINNNKDMENHK